MEEFNANSLAKSWGHALVNLLIFFILPWKTYKNTVETFEEENQENEDPHFPVYSWLLKVFGSLILLVWPLSIIYVLIQIFLGRTWWLAQFAIFAYFAPLYISLTKEILFLALKQYYGIVQIAENTSPPKSEEAD